MENNKVTKLNIGQDSSFLYIKSKSFFFLFFSFIKNVLVVI